MRLIDINKEQLNEFLSKQEHVQFLQSWEWGEFQETAGNKIFRFGVEDEGKLVDVITLIKKRLFFGFGYFFAPRCFNFQLSITHYELLFEKIKELAKKEKCIFLRFEPIKKLEIRNKKYQIIETIPLQPKKTLILDISKSEEEILKQMHSKTRYNIRLAERNGVETQFVASMDNAKEDFEEFWKIMQETNERDGFRLHSKEYYQKMLFNIQYSISNNHSISNNKYSNTDLLIKLIVAKYQNKIIAGNIVAFFGDTATYVHGASANEQRNLMATYALQWQSIKEAKARGCRYYDFFGIDENKWPGVTRFKRGFGGEEVNYPGTFDIMFDSVLYKMYNLLRWMRRRF